MMGGGWRCTAGRSQSATMMGGSCGGAALRCRSQSTTVPLIVLHSGGRVPAGNRLLFSTIATSAVSVDHSLGAQQDR